jgi:hypothetical protein
VTLLTLLSQHALQSRHWLPWSAAGHVLLFVDTVDVQGQNFTGPWSIICEDIRMIKFFGMASGSIRDRSLASRVGIQCQVSGVLLQTSKICLRCAAPCRSPESCHLKYFSPLINTTIACTHWGCLRLCSLRANAIRTLLNRYRPFRA